MDSPRRTAEKALYKRLFISESDLRYALHFAEFLLKKGWHFNPWEKRGSIYIQQAAFTSALIVFYCRPFTRSKGLPSFPSRLILYSADEMKLHNEIRDLRHEVYAHSDTMRYRVTPMELGDLVLDVASVPFFKLTAEQTQQLRGMILRTIAAIKPELDKLRSQTLIDDLS